MCATDVSVPGAPEAHHENSQCPLHLWHPLLIASVNQTRHVRRAPQHAEAGSSTAFHSQPSKIWLSSPDDTIEEAIREVTRNLPQKAAQRRSCTNLPQLPISSH